MARRNQVFGSGYLKKDDFWDGKAYKTMPLTISAVEDGTLPETNEPCRELVFKETEKRLSLNQENFDSLAVLSGQKANDPNADDEKFVGVKMEAFIDPEVKFKGRKVGGIRFRKA